MIIPQDGANVQADHLSQFGLWVNPPHLHQVKAIAEDLDIYDVIGIRKVPLRIKLHHLPRLCVEIGFLQVAENLRYFVTTVQRLVKMYFLVLLHTRPP